VTESPEKITNVVIDVLLVEDNEVQSFAAQRAFSSCVAFRVTAMVVQTLAAALEEISKRSFDVIVLDLGLPDSDGIATFRAVQQAAATVAIVVLSAIEDEQLAATAVREGAQDYLLKSYVDPALLVRSVVYAFHRQSANTQLQWSRARFRAVFEHAVDAILVFDEHATVTDGNAVAEQLLGTSPGELLGRAFAELFESETDIYSLWDEFVKAGVATGELSFRSRDSKRHTVEYSATAHVASGMHVWTLHDITDRRLLEAQLFRSRQMDALGRVAAGVAHDFNNILMVMSSYCELLRDKLVGDEVTSRYIGQMMRATERGTSLTHQMLAFCRQDGATSKVTDLNIEVAESLKMISRLLGEDIEIQFEPAREGCVIHAIDGSIAQIILNLCVNARDAMPSGGMLRVTTENVWANESFCRDHPAASIGKYVRLCVSDTGVGMSPDVQERIFEPFFTTKQSGIGTGLGLATVYAIVTSMRGLISVDSAVGNGSTLTFYLPAEQEIPFCASVAPSASRIPGRGRIVLLVEDEPAIREAVSEELTKIGYTVVAAGSGDEAIALASDANRNIEIIITDVVMPKMNGRELVDAIRVTHPRASVLFISGYSGDVLERNGIPDGAQLLRKPFSLAALEERIAQCESCRVQ
jgi:two-component system, cell cycle sensor histidine kinase and response regulator CckA